MAKTKNIARARSKITHRWISGFLFSSMLAVLLSAAGPSSLTNAASPQSCPVIDGDVGDSDGLADGTITINANTTWNTTGFSALGDYWNCSGKTIHVTNNATLTFQGDRVNGYYPYLQAANVTIDSGSKISANGEGCTADANLTGKGANGSNVCVSGNGGGVGASATQTGAGGGANAGDGGAGTTQAGGTHKTFTKTPTHFGSAGGSGNAGIGGSGGGVVRMLLTGTLNLNGNIEANGFSGGTNSTNRAGGGGSGGSIYLDVDTIAGANGSIQAQGGAGANNSTADGGGGSGGIVAIYFNTDSYTNSFTPNNINVNGGSGPDTAIDGEKGSAYYKEKDTNSEIYAYKYYVDNTAINNASGPITFDQMDISCEAGTSGITLSSSSGLTFGGALNCSDAALTDVDFVAGGGNFNLIDGTNINVPVEGVDLDFTIPANSTTNWNNVTISTGVRGDFVINDAATINLQGNTTINSNVNWTALKGFSSASNTSINANNLGCTDAYPGSALAGMAPNNLNVCTRGESGAGAGNKNAGGGGHGGAGANGATTGGISYDSETTPVLYGSTGGNTTESNSIPGSGGGKVRIDVAGNFSHSGSISANGGSPTNSLTDRSPGGGSGGSIYISLTGAYSGTDGTLSVAGGAPNTGGTRSAGGGAGGRVYVVYGTNSSNYLASLNATTVAPGGGTGGVQGGTGTFIQTAPPTPPDAPVVSTPTSGQLGVSVNPSLSTNAYAGTGDAHQDTDWKIVAFGDSCDDAYVAQNLSTTDDLLSTNVNHLNWTFANGSALRYSTQYTLCARHRSVNNNTESNWTLQNFTTENLADWSNNMTLRVTNPNAGNLNNYQVRVQIDNTFFNFANARSDGSDIRFSDAGGGLAYPHYIADWDSVNEKAVVWVMVPSINGSNGTTDMRMYFGNNSATTIPTSAGPSTFLDFWDEDNFSDWNNGSSNGEFAVFTKDGDNWNIQDTAGNQMQDASVQVNTAVSSLSAVTLETRVQLNNVSGSSDNMTFVITDDAGMSNRTAQIWMPYYQNQGKYGMHENGTNKVISSTAFEFNVFKEVSIKQNISGGDYDYYIKNTDGTDFTSFTNRAKAKNNPDNINYVRLVTAGANSHKSNANFDFIAFRQHADTEPTVTPTGNTPVAPSITNPTGGANQQFTNPNIQGSDYSGDFSLISVDAKIMTGNSCSSGTPVWEMTDSTLGNNFSVNSYFGSFGGTLAGKDALKFNTTYYACIRYANLIGDSAWSSPVAFTTEDLGGFSRSTTATISNSGTQLDNHQVRIVLNSTNFDFAATRSDGADIRFSSSDDTQAYPHYLESFDPVGKTAVAWVRFDSLPNAGDKNIKIHYSNSPKNTVPANAGEAVFLEFIDENDVNRFINSHEDYSGFDSISSASSAIRFQDTDVSTSSGAEISVGGVVPTLDTYTIETRVKVADTDASNDHFFFGPADTSSENRNYDFMLPRYDDANAFAHLSAGATTWTKVADGNFAFDTYYNIVTDMFETTGDTDMTIFDQGRNSLGVIDQNAPSVGSQTKTDKLQFYTRPALTSAKTDAYVDYVAFRQYTANTVTVSIVGGPNISNLSAVEDTNGTGNVTVNFDIDSVGDSAQVQAKVEYSIDGGSTWADPTLLTDPSMVNASIGGKPTIDNAAEYQVGKTGGWIDTSGGAVSLSLKWNANNDTNEDDTDMQIRVTGYDNVTSFAGLVTATPNNTLDVVAPSVPATPGGTATSSSVALTWAATTETNFSHYEVWYGTDQTDANNRNGTAIEWDDNPDDVNLATLSTTTTTITGLAGETQYFFKICAIDDFGFEGCSNSFSKTTGAQPTVESVTAVQKSDGTGHIDVSVTVDDADDDDTLRFTVQDNCSGSYENSVLLSSDASVTATYGDPGVSGNTIGTSGNWITTSSNTAETKNTVQFDLNGNNCTDLEDTYQVKITLNDGGGDITPITASMIVDQKDPTAPSNLSAESGTSSILPLTWTPGDDKNFNHYEIWYGANQTKVSNETTTAPNGAIEFDNDPDDAALANKSTNSTTLVNVSGTIYAKVCAVDDYNNKTCTATTSVTPNVAPVANQILTEHKSNTRTNVCTTVLDADQPGTMHLGADYSTNNGNTWTKMTVVSGTISATDGATPSLNQGSNHQIRNIDMSDGSNQVCFDWNTGNDISNNSSGLLVRFRPYDGTSEGVSGNGDGAVNSPPVARFAPTCTDLSCSFSSSNSSDPDGSIASRAWSFGDGTTSSSSNPSKVYSSAGTYTVTLTVTDDNGQTDSAEKEITVTASGSNAVQISNEPPEAVFVPSCSGLTCSFNSSNSTDEDGTISSYLWNFGDGTSSTSANPSRTYSSDGVYKVKLTVTDNDSDSDSTSQTISVFAASQAPDTSNDNEAPKAKFNKSCNGLTCSFNAGTSSDSDGSIASYTWTFGDGTTATGATPSVTYTAAGTYNVRLEVVDNDGAYDVKFRNITISTSGSESEGNEAPNAAYTKSCTGLTCTFNASTSSDSDGSIANYYWSFGNGAIVTTQSAIQVKTFPNSGTYRVTLVVEDDGGLKDMTRQEERVFNSDSGAGGGGGVTVMIDNQAPSGFGGVTSTANTSTSIALEWDTVSEDNFNRYECWYGTDATKVANRDSSAPNGAVRWDESYDVNMMDRTRDNTTVNQNIAEDTNYTFKCWAKDIYDNEVTFDAITQKSNDKPDILGTSQEFTTDGEGKLNFNAEIDDNDDVPVSLVYHYNNGSGWQEMTLENATAGTGNPDVSGNVVGATSKVPTVGDSNTVAAVWATKTDLPNFEGTLQIRTYANDSIENGEQAILQDVVVDNLAPRGLAGLSGSFVSGAREGGKTKADNIRESKQRTSDTPTLEAASASITLNWTPVDNEANWSGIAAYWVEYGLAAETLDQTWDKTDDTDLSIMATSTTTISGLETGTTYYLKIYAQDQFGNRSTLDTISVTTTAEEVSGGGGGGGSSSSSSSGAGSYNFTVNNNNDDKEEDSEEIQEDEEDGSLPIPEHLQGANDDTDDEDNTIISIGDTSEPEEDYEVETVVVNVGGEFRSELPRHWSAEYLEELLADETVQELAEEDNDFVILLLRMLQRPDEEMNREEAVQLLIALADLEITDEEAKNLNDNFSDISPSNNLGALIEFSFEEGLINGYDDGTFRPENNVNRVEALKMIQTFYGLNDNAEAHKYSTIPFSDVLRGAWYADTLMYAYDNQIVNGYDDGRFGPGDEVTYSQFLKMALLTRSLEDVELAF